MLCENNCKYTAAIIECFRNVAGMQEFIARVQTSLNSGYKIVKVLNNGCSLYLSLNYRLSSGLECNDAVKAKCLVWLPTSLSFFETSSSFSG